MIKKLTVVGGALTAMLTGAALTFAQTADATAVAVLTDAGGDLKANVDAIFGVMLAVVIPIIVLFFGFALLRRKILGSAR